MTGIWNPEANTWQGDGEDWRYTNIHEFNIDCDVHGCMIHAPSYWVGSDWPYEPRADGRMERTCPHGIGHPDPDVASYLERKGIGHWVWVHGCDGCCHSAY